MIPMRPNVVPNGRYAIRVAAMIMEVSESTIRNWIKHGVFKTKEYNYRKIGHKGLFVTGEGLIRIWRECGIG